MNFQHVTLRFFPRITEDALEHHRHVGHEIHRVVVHHDLPREIECFFPSSFFFPDRCFHRGCRSLFERPGAHRAHEKMLSHCPRTSNYCVGKNSSLNALHFPRAGFISIVESVKVKQTVNYVQA